MKNVRSILESSAAEPALLAGVIGAMKTLVAQDDWLTDAYATPHPDYYVQYLLFRDPAARFRS